MYITKNMLMRELERMEDGFVTLIIDGKEYPIDRIGYEKTYSDRTSTHIGIYGKESDGVNIAR